jgi:hypothetical protein
MVVVPEVPELSVANLKEVIDPQRRKAVCDYFDETWKSKLVVWNSFKALTHCSLGRVKNENSSMAKYGPKLFFSHIFVHILHLCCVCYISLKP